MTMPSIYDAGTQANGTGAISIAWGTHGTNFISLVVVKTRGEETLSNVAAGWTQIATVTNGTGAGSVRLSMYWKRAPSGGQSAFTADDPGDHWVGRNIMVKDCVTSGNPVNYFATQTAGSSTTASFALGSSTNNNCLVMTFFGHGTDSTATQWGSNSVTDSSLTSVSNNGWVSTTDGDGGGYISGIGEKVTAGTLGTMAFSAAMANATLHADIAVAFSDTATSGATEHTTTVDFTGDGVFDISAPAITTFTSTNFDGAGAFEVDAAVTTSTSVDFTGDGTFEVDATRVLDTSANFDGASTFEVDATVTLATAVNFDGAGAFEVDAAVTTSTSIDFTGDGTFEVDATRVLDTSVSFDGDGAFDISAPAVTTSTSANFDGAGAFEVDATRTTDTSANFDGAGAFEVDATVIPAGTTSVDFTGAGSFEVDATRITDTSVSFDGTGAFDVDATRIADTSVGFDGAGAFDVDATRTADTSANFDGVGAFNVDAAVTTSTSIDFTGASVFDVTVGESQEVTVNFNGDGLFNVIFPFGLGVLTTGVDGVISTGAVSGSVHTTGVSPT